MTLFKLYSSSLIGVLFITSNLFLNVSVISLTGLHCPCRPTPQLALEVRQTQMILFFGFRTLLSLEARVNMLQNETSTG